MLRKLGFRGVWERGSPARRGSMNKAANQGIRWLLAVCTALVLGSIVLGQTTSPKVVGPRIRYSVVSNRSWESGYTRPVASGEADLRRQLFEEYLNKRGQEGWV